MFKLKIVTTSWDDGDPKDLRIAELLRSRGLRGTFYVPLLGYAGRKTIGDRDLKAIFSEELEIGAHSVTHKSLSGLNCADLKREVRDCKSALEQVLGRQVLTFCYPNGRYDCSVVQQVKEAGYKGARTTQMLSCQLDFKPFEMPTTIQAYPHPRAAYLRNLGRAKNVLGLVRNLTNFRYSRTWVALGKQLFDGVLENGGIWHLYGHSWEIDELGIWDDLREMLDYVSGHHHVIYVTNGQLLSLPNNGERLSSVDASVEQCSRGAQDEEKHISCSK
jgi:peptidoglycan-N-acetylglucosamine deacetylase